MKELFSQAVHHFPVQMAPHVLCSLQHEFGSNTHPTPVHAVHTVLSWVMLCKRTHFLTLCTRGDHEAMSDTFMNHKIIIKKQSHILYVLHVLEITRSIIDACDTTRDSMIKAVFANTFHYSRVGNSCCFLPLSL